MPPQGWVKLLEFGRFPLVVPGVIEVIEPTACRQELQQTIECALQILGAARQEASVQFAAHPAGQRHQPAPGRVQHTRRDTGRRRGAAGVALGGGDLDPADWITGDLGIAPG